MRAFVFALVLLSAGTTSAGSPPTIVAPRAILLDPEFGLAAAAARSRNAGLLLAYEATGYDNTQPGRLPDLLPHVSVKRIQDWGADAVKILIYYSPFDDPNGNDIKHAFVERIGGECEYYQMPFFLEFVGYDPAGGDEKGVEFAKKKPQVVIIGAGFGGLAAVRRLARSGMQVTLIDRNVYSTFQPLLYEVATAGLTSSDVAYPARSESRRYRAAFRHGELAGIGPAAREIVLSDGAKLGYDYLILATGVTAGCFGITGAAEYSHALYTLHDAAAMRARILAGRDRLEAALGQLGFSVCPSEANFVWCRNETHPVRAIYEELKRRHILVRYMSYEDYGDGLRITVGSDEEIGRLLDELARLV